MHRSKNSGQTRPTPQEQLLAFLCNPKSYSHRPRKVDFVQTHASFVFIAAPFVYKVKKPVNFGFLDFSTLAKRKHYCEREVQLNRRLSPGMYLDVVPITRTKDALAFGGVGEVIEYAVKMRKLSERYFLHRLIQRNVVGTKDLDRVAALLRRFYKAQQPTPEIEAWGRIERLKISTNENFSQTERFIGKTISRAGFEAIRFFTQQFYKCRAPLFRARLRQRWIRDCHGDLHLEHIHLAPRALQIYDCIEFNDRLRYVDVASDLAFLAMDLDFRGRPDLGRHFISKMSAGLSDPQLFELVDFYKCYRAYVRGKVESLRSVARSAPAAERAKSAERAADYFHLAARYAVAGSGAFVLVVMGRVASGKTTLAQSFARELGWEIVSSDRLRKELSGLPVHRRTPAQLREKVYAKQMTEVVYGRLFGAAERAAKQGAGVVLDATFSQRAKRAQLIELFTKLQVRFQIIEVLAENKIVQRRLARRETQRGEISDARSDDFVKLDQRYEPPVELPAACLIRLRTESAPQSTIQRALHEMVSRQLRGKGPSKTLRAPRP